MPKPSLYITYYVSYGIQSAYKYSADLGAPLTLYSKCQFSVKNKKYSCTSLHNYCN